MLDFYGRPYVPTVFILRAQKIYVLDLPRFRPPCLVVASWYVVGSASYDGGDFGFGTIECDALFNTVEVAAQQILR